MWDCKSQQRMPIQVLDDARDSVTCLVIRGHEVIVGCVDGNVRSYDVRKGKLTADFFESAPLPSPPKRLS